jgi:hypothetical protein
MTCGLDLIEARWFKLAYKTVNCVVLAMSNYGLFTAGDSLFASAKEKCSNSPKSIDEFPDPYLPSLQLTLIADCNPKR